MGASCGETVMQTKSLHMGAIALSVWDHRCFDHSTCAFGSLVHRACPENRYSYSLTPVRYAPFERP